METAALWKALEKQHKTQSLENGSGGSLVSHSSHRPGGYGHTKNQEIRVGSVLCWRHSKAPSAWAPAIALTGTSAGLCRTRFSQKRRLFRPGGSLSQNGHLVHHEMLASLCSDKVAFLTGICTPHRFKLIWPVLESKYGDQLPAERQAATMMYHDIKSRGLRLAIHGPRLAFFEFLMLPSGYTVGQLEVPELVAHLPEALQPKLLGA